MLKKDWGVSLCARVLLRTELGREPTHEEVEYAQEFRTAQCIDKEVRPEEITEAYLLSDEVTTRYCHV